MSQFWRVSAITLTALFLEATGAFLAFSMFTALTNTAEARLPLWLVFLALVWSFILSLYVQTIRFSLNLRGVIGLFISILSLLVLTNLNSGLGFFPIGRLIFGDLHAAFALALSFVFSWLACGGGVPAWPMTRCRWRRLGRRSSGPWPCW